MKVFNEFIKNRIVKIQIPDKSRAQFLILESEKSYNNLLTIEKKLGVDDNNSNIFVKICYDLLMEIIRAKMLQNGYNASGSGAHEAEISYLQTFDFSIKEIEFLDQIRYFRNGIVYHGAILESEYAKKVVKFTKEFYIVLKKKFNF